jgi:serine/threonine-protein kinase
MASLKPGAHIGPYEVVSLLGSGGMGEVYRARDSKLDRQVAIKILSGGFVRDADRTARLVREAQLLASLNHPNIGAIYDVQETDIERFLVLELIEGETLADRIRRGPVPVDEALGYAKQITNAWRSPTKKESYIAI